MEAKAGVSLPQLAVERGAWGMLGAHLFRNFLITNALTAFFITDVLLMYKLLGDNQRALRIVTHAMTLVFMVALYYLNRGSVIFIQAFANHVGDSPSTFNPATPLTLARILKCTGVIFLLTVVCFSFVPLSICYSLLVVSMSFEYRYAYFIMSYAAVVIQIAVVVFLIRGGKQAVAFLAGEQFPPASTLSTEVPMLAASSMEVEEGSSEGRGGVSMTSFSTTTITSAETAPVNVLSSMRSALSGLAANISLSNPSASVTDGAYSVCRG